MLNNILHYFPKDLSIRPSQRKALTEIQAVWDKSDVIVISLPTAFGKSAMAKTIMDWTERAAYITPTNMLVQQFKDTYNKVPNIFNKSLYSCSEPGYHNCEDRADAYQYQKKKYCSGCPYVRDNKRIMNPYRKQSNSTVHMYIARQMYQPVLIADEAHTLINVLSEYHSVKIQHKRFKYPISKGYINRAELRFWLESLKNIDTILTDVKRGQKGLKVLYNELINNNSQYLIKEEQSGNDRCLKLIPIDLRGLPSPLWPAQRVNKIVLMSATINKKDIESLGLSGRRVNYINADSPIPAENRPALLVTGPSLNKNNLTDSLTHISEHILGILNHHKGEKGILHATYQVADMLKKMQLPDNRLIFHDKYNKTAQFERFKDSQESGERDSVLVASGMYEGIDLPYDAGRFQIIVKIPWPNLGEPAIKLKADLDNEWYEWSALKDTLQAYGRIVRSPDDYGVTYILDNSFKRLLDNPALPEWFRAAYQEII